MLLYCLQATLLSMEAEAEVLDYVGPAAASSGALVWRLSTAEIRTVLGLRVDFSKDRIARLQL